MPWIVTVKTNPIFLPPKFRVRLVSMPDAGKQQKAGARFNDFRWCFGRFEQAAPTGNEDNIVSIEDTPFIPRKYMVCRVLAYFGIPAVFVNFSIANRIDIE